MREAFSKVAELFIIVKYSSGITEEIYQEKFFW